jgi:hypothetical protein
MCPVGVFSTASDYASIASIVSKWQPFIFNWGNREKQGGWGTTVMLFLVWNSLVEKEVREGALSWCKSQLFCRQNLGQSLLTFSHSRGKTSQ